jgi:hypothetical protein
MPEATNNGIAEEGKRNEQKRRKLEGKESPTHSQPNYFSSTHTFTYLQPRKRRNHLRQRRRLLFSLSLSFFSLGARSATTKLIGGRSAGQRRAAVAAACPC